MKNLISKILFVFTASILLSCSKNDDPATLPEKNPQFFNLNVGNIWVYKNYQNIQNLPNQNELTFTGIVDTVKIIGIENIQGFTFAKKKSKKIFLSTGNVKSISYSYLRVNNLGHLIEITDINNIGVLNETSGYVIHPGNDVNFVYNQEINNGSSEVIYGNIEYRIYNSINKEVEGINYFVTPFNGIFTPTPASLQNGIISKTVEFNYSSNVGLIKSLSHSLFGPTIFEERLVYYQLK